MKKWELLGARKLLTTFSNPCFHSKIIEKNFPMKKRFFSFPLLLLREGSGVGFVWENKLSFPIHLHFLRNIISPIFYKTRMEAENQFLQLTAQKEKRAYDIYQKVADIQAIIKENESNIKKVMYSILKGIYTFSGPVARNSSLLSCRRSQIPINQVYPAYGIFEKSFRTLFSAKGGIKNLNQKFSKGTIIGKTLPGGNDIFENTSALNPTSFSRLTANLNSHLIVTLDSAFDPGPALEGFPGKELYPQASGKELVFNSAANVTQELEREVEGIKKGLSQAEKTIHSNYSSIYSKVEEELKQRFEINRISEQVIQQIVWRLKIEKERRGLL